MYRRLVLLGPPAAGKGTQAELLKEQFGFQTPSVGALLREQKAAGTPVGLRAAEYFERGLLVPDEVSIEVVRQWLAANDGAWVIDGFPRTLGQAQAFEAMLGDRGEPVEAAIVIDTAESAIRERVTHRVTCKQCGGIFRIGMHIAAASDPCPRCAGALARRADDNVEALADRLSEYAAKTAPVIGWYEARGILCRIDGNPDIQTVFAQVTSALEAAHSSRP